MKTKKAPAKKAKTKKDYKLLLALDDKAQKQLQIVYSMTAEKTATKAIIKSMYQAEYFMNRFEEEKNRAEALEIELSRYKNGISSLTASLKQIDELSKSKPVTTAKVKTGKGQLTVETCNNCGEPLNTHGECRICDM